MYKLIFNIVLMTLMSSTIFGQSVQKEGQDYLLIYKDGNKEKVFTHTSSKYLDVIDFYIADRNTISVALLDVSKKSNVSFWVIVCKKDKNGEWKYDWSIFQANKFGEFQDFKEILNSIRFNSLYELNVLNQGRNTKRINLIEIEGNRPMKGIFKQ